jgi:hypothetical protein
MFKSSRLAMSDRVRPESVSRADHVRCLEAFGALQQIKLHRLPFVESAVSVFLDRRKMNEHVLTGGALDESISLCPVEPLHCSLLSHGTAPFAFSRRIHSFRLAVLPGDQEHPLKSDGTGSRSYASDKTAPNRKSPVLPGHPDTMARDSRSPTKREFRLLDTKTSTQLARCLADRNLPAEHRIICSASFFGKQDFIESVLESYSSLRP